MRDEFTLLIKIKRSYVNSVELGKKGTIVFDTDYNDNIRNLFNISDIEEKTGFNAVLSSSSKLYIYNVICRFWKAPNGNINIFCNLKGNETLAFPSQDLMMNLVELKYNNNYTIIIKSTEIITIRQLNYEIPFI